MLGPDQVNIRCQFCGDSQKDLTHAHFNVKVNPNVDEPILFHCYRCDIGGVLTPSILRSFKVNDLQLNSGLLSYNKSVIGSLSRQLGIFNNDFHFTIPIPKLDDKTKRKKAYIEKRLGRQFTIEELVDMKVVFNLGEFLRQNGIEKITCRQDKAKIIHEDYVGFLTSKNEFINFRDVTGTHNRYEKYNIYNNLDNTRKHYTIPNDIDLLSTDEMVINIAEGVFDIFGLYYNVFSQEKKNMIYAAVCGSGYITVIKYFIQMGVFGNVTVNIFSDNERDRQPRFYKDMITELKDWVTEFNLYYNEIGKDYGVRQDQIKIIKRRI